MLLTNEDFAVGAACHLNLRCIVKQINPALSTLECVSCLGTTHIAEKSSGKAYVQSVRFLSTKLSLQHREQLKNERRQICVSCMPLSNMPKCRKRRSSTRPLMLPGSFVRVCPVMSVNSKSDMLVQPVTSLACWSPAKVKLSTGHGVRG